MQLNTAKYSPVSENSLTVFAQDSIFMISSNSEHFDLFRKYDSQFNPQNTSPIDLIKNVYHQIKSETSECLIIKVVDELVYILCAGGTGAFVLRDNNLVPLAKTSSNDNLTVSGQIKSGDSFMFSTHEVIANISLEDIKDKLSQGDIGSVVDKFDSGPVLLMQAGQYVSEVVKEAEVNPDQTIKSQNSFKSKLVGGIDSILDKMPSNKIIVDQEEVKSSKKRTASVVGLILLILLSVSIYFGLKADSERRRKAEYEPQLLEAEHNLSEARDLADLSPVRAQELILTSRQIALSLKEKGIEDERLEKLLSDIQTNLGDIAGIYEGEADLFLDLSLISSEFIGNDISLSGGNIRVLDFETKRLVGIDVESKRTEVISGPDFLPDALQTFSYEDRSFILSSDGIREVTDDVELVIKPEWDPEKILLHSFAGNIYLVNKENGEVLRHTGVRGGFLESENWLGEGIEMNFENAISMTIDGNIWVLESNGNIDRLSNGVPVNFSLSGERVNLDNPVAMFTTDESEFLYILDTSKSRIAVFNKDGQYVGEYTNSQLGNSTDLVVSEEFKKAIFLSDGKLYSVELRHLPQNSSEDNE